jgi:hypothetical protein
MQQHTLAHRVLRGRQRRLVLAAREQPRGLLARELEQAELERLHEVVAPAVGEQRLHGGRGEQRDAARGHRLDGQAEGERGGQHLALCAALLWVLAGAQLLRGMGGA